VKYIRKSSIEANDVNNRSSFNSNNPNNTKIINNSNSFLDKRRESFNFSSSESDSEMNFQYNKFIIFIQKSNFLIQSLFEGEKASPSILLKNEFYSSKLNLNDYLYNFNNDFSNTHFITFENGNYIFHTQNNTLNVSYYNQFEEINISSSIPLESKFSVVFMNKFTAPKTFKEKDIKENDTLLFVIYKDLSLVIYKFNTIINQLEKIHKIYLMIEDEYSNMKFLMLKNLLIGHLEEHIFIFDLDNFNLTKEEKFVDSTIELNNLFDKKNDPLHFTNYFKDNFKEKYKYFMNSIIMQTNNNPQNYDLKGLKKKFTYIHDGEITKIKKKEQKGEVNLHHNTKYDKNINNRAINATDLNSEFKKRSKENKSFKITSSTILTDPENISIYYIFGTDVGKIAIIDIFFDENMGLNPIFLLNYHITKVYFMTIIDQKYLISASEDGVISITYICKSTIERALERFKSESKRNSITRSKKDSLSKLIKFNYYIFYLIFVNYTIIYKI